MQRDQDGCLGGLIQPGLPLVIVVIALFTWPYIARHRARLHAVAAREGVRRGEPLARAPSNTRIIFREILPNLLGPIIVYTTLLIPQNILFEAALSYLGLGVPPDDRVVGRAAERRASATTTSPGG